MSVLVVIVMLLLLVVIFVNVDFVVSGLVVDIGVWWYGFYDLIFDWLVDIVFVNNLDLQVVVVCIDVVCVVWIGVVLLWFLFVDLNVGVSCQWFFVLQVFLIDMLMIGNVFDLNVSFVWEVDIFGCICQGVLVVDVDIVLV